MNNKEKPASWLWWMLGLLVVTFVIIGRCPRQKGAITKLTNEKEVSEVEISNDTKAKTQEVIVLKPGKNITLEINDKEWSPWIDASKVYSYPHTSDYGIKQLFSNGDSLTVKPGERIKLLPKNKGYSIYRLKTPL